MDKPATVVWYPTGRVRRRAKYLNAFVREIKPTGPKEMEVRRIGSTELRWQDIEDAEEVTV